MSFNFTIDINAAAKLTTQDSKSMFIATECVCVCEKFTYE